MKVWQYLLLRVLAAAVLIFAEYSKLNEFNKDFENYFSEVLFFCTACL